MRLKVIVSFIISLAAAFSSFGQDNSEYTQSRILFLLDRSSSMIQPWSGGREKYKIADEIIEKLMDSVNSVNDQVEFSLRVFGHQHPVPENDCTDTRNEVPFSKANRTRIQFRLEDIHPLGVTAIAYTLQQAAENDITDESHNAYSIILITDGGESCGGDICETMEKLVKNKVYFKPYILSLEADPALRKEYACVGNYLEVTKKGDINTAVGTIVEAFRPMLKITKSEYKHIQAISKEPVVPAVKKPVARLDTLVIEPVKVKPIDTLVTVAPKKSNIKVDEVITRPAAIKMTKVKLQSIPKLFASTRGKFKPQEITIAEPDIAPAVPEVVRTPTVKIKPIKIAAITRRQLPQVADYVPKAFKLVIPETPPAEVIAPRPVAIKIKKIKQADIPVIANDFKPSVLRLRPVTVTEVIVITEPPVVLPPPVTHETPKIAKLKQSRIKRFPLVFMLEESNFPMVKVSEPVKATEIIVPVAKTKPPVAAKPTTTKPTTPKTGEYSVLHDDASETTLEVYLTNGRGKFYYSTPRVILTDPTTGKEFKKFYRTINQDNNPDPQKNIPAGKYDLTIDGRDDLLAHIDVLPNKKTLVYVIVKDYSLFFTYAGNRDRPVKEFSAIVIQRNTTNGKVINQKCTEKLIYEPGNYHVIINTLPEDVRNLDMDDIGPGGIEIAQPGYADFTTDNPAVSTITLFKELGDKYVSFHKMDINDPDSKHLRIQPGKYQAHYQNGAAKFSSTEKVVSFTVRSNEDTQVILK